jgi:flagellum-specific ATP synthase
MAALDQHPYLLRLKNADFVRHLGHVTRVLPGFIETDGPNVSIGTVCQVFCSDGRILMAESVSATTDAIALMPYGATDGVRVGDKVQVEVKSSSVWVGREFLGRAVDGLGNPVDGGAPVHGSVGRSLHGVVTRPMERGATLSVVETGVRAIDSLLTLATGQRIGVFAGSGVGKTTMVNAISRNVDCDVKVICLVGERGREAAEFWRNNVSDADRGRTVLVASTSDQPAVLRVRAVHLALVLAEYFREQSLHVLFVMDSITRYAMALREIGLAIGEPPTTRAYTPSVFAALPKVVERCGAAEGGGAITAVFSVLAESDDVEDPLSEIMRSLLDGHLLLSRELAEQGRYPAIDVTRSISRLMSAVVSPQEVQAAHAAVAALAQYEKSRILIETGAYKGGNSAEIDRAIAMHARLVEHMAQDLSTKCSRASGVQALEKILGDHSAK